MNTILSKEVSLDRRLRKDAGMDGIVKGVVYLDDVLEVCWFA